MATPSSDNEVRYDIKIEAKAAITSLREFLKITDDVNRKTLIFSETVMRQSKLMGIHWSQLLGVYKQLNAELSKQHKPTLFGNVGGKDVFGDAAKIMQGWESAGRAFDTAGNSAKKMGDEVEKAGHRSVRGIDVMRTALGVLVSMLIFNVIQAIQNTFRTMIDNLKEAETAMFNLINAEQKLSEEGIDVTPKGLDDLINKLQEINPLLSQIQAEELVSSIATKVAPALGLGQKEIESLSVSIALLTVRNMAMGKSFEEVMAQVETGLLSGKVTTGINSLGAKITDLAVKEKARDMGLIKTIDDYDKLDSAQKEHITALSIIAILEENRNKELENLPKFLQTATAEIGEANKQWNDFLTILGKAFGPLIGQGFEVIAHFLKVIIALLEAGMPVIQVWVASMVALVDTMRNLPQYLKFGGPGDMLNNFKDSFDAVMESFKGLAEVTDTPTSDVKKFGEAIKEIDTSALEKAEDIFRDTAEAVEDLNQKLSEKLADLGTEYARKAEDAERDLQRKIEDINRDTERKRSELKDKHRREDEKSEAEYQLRLWELRQRFLMNLEDALHARDARQVIRLQKEYKLDKEALRRKHELENKEREESQREELENIEEERQRRIEDAKIEYEQKLADLNTAMQREAEDLQKWYEREYADIQLAQDRKLKALLDGWAKEQELTEANAAQIYAILQKYFGPSGLTDQLYQYMMSSMLATTAAAAGSLNALLGLANGVNPFAGGVTVPAPAGSLNGEIGLPMGTNPFAGQGFAEGGTLLATRPTRALFGEGGPELVNFTPLNRVGKNINKIFGDRSGGGVNGQIRVLVDLSPDLEGRIVEQSLDGVAEVISKVGRMKA